MPALIEASGLVKSYAGRKVVNGIHLCVEEGEALAIIGPNGAGKSTTLDLLLGLRKPDRGHIRYWIEDPFPHIGVQLQSTPFFAGFNALENMRMFAAFYGLRLSDKTLIASLDRCGLSGAAKIDAGKLSGGQQKRLSIAMSMLHSPKLLFLDEPTAALDPRARMEVRGLIRSLADAGTSILFTSHDMEEVSKLATRIVMIDNGQITANGTAEQLLEQHRAASLEELYLELTGESL